MIATTERWAIRSCKKCGIAFPENTARTGRRQEYCRAGGCRHGKAVQGVRAIGVEVQLKANRGNPRVVRACVICATRFKQNTSTQAACSRECGFELLRYRKGAESSLRKEAERQAREGHELRDCQWCGVVYPTAKSSIRMYCCRDCSWKARNYQWGNNWSKAKCDECGKEFVARNSRRKYCADGCAIRVQKRNNRHRRRVRLRDAPTESFTSREIFERDAWRCGLCERKTNPNKQVPHPKAPTLDHIVPVSKGGAHTRRNVQCACFRCNSNKQADPRGSQLRLIG